MLSGKYLEKEDPEAGFWFGVLSGKQNGAGQGARQGPVSAGDLLRLSSWGTQSSAIPHSSPIGRCVGVWVTCNLRGGESCGGGSSPLG